MKPTSHRAWLLLIPAGLLLGFVGILPLVAVVNYSFLDLFVITNPFWVGVQWYEAIVASPRFYASLGRSLAFSALVLAVQLPLGVAIALFIRTLGRWRTPVLLLMAVPLLVPWNMIPMLWLDLLNPSRGRLALALQALGVGFDYKFNPVHTWIVLVVMDTWHWLGLVVVLATAGLSSIPGVTYQAAAIDSASRLQVFRFIELPRMADVLAMAVLLRFMDSLMIYTEAFRINAGGPHEATAFLALDLGEEINAFNYGPAAARSVLYFLIVITVAWAWRSAMAARRAGGPEPAR
ncbi:MAG: sugar ABC transporter permease [Alsobacter sp.]